MQKINSLSVFFPFWNEEKNIETVVESAIPVVSVIADKWEILIIDDGSTDNTAKIASSLAEKHKEVRVITNNSNRGYGGALQEGFRSSQYEYVVFADGDGQFDFSEIKRFIEKIKNNDLVIGFREKRRDNVVRHVLMNMLKIWDYIFFGFRFKDIDCGFKMFKKDALEELMPFRSEGAMITTEILAKAKKRKLKISEVPVSHYSREFGKQSGANLFVISRAIFESLILWQDLRNGKF